MRKSSKQCQHGGYVASDKLTNQLTQHCEHQICNVLAAKAWHGIGGDLMTRNDDGSGVGTWACGVARVRAGAAM